MQARTGSGKRWLGAVAAVLLTTLALPAAAVPVDVFFTGVSTPGAPGTNYGLSESEALAANADFGVPIIDDLSYVGSSSGTLEAIPSYNPSSLQSSFTGSENRASSTWTVDNVSTSDFSGSTYLLFTHTDPFTLDGVLIDYADANVGLTIDAALGWVIVNKVDATYGAFYYAAMLLDRSVSDPLDGFLGAGDSSAGFTVNYIIKEALTPAPIGSAQFQLPEFNAGMGFTPVPEPATATLLALGLLALAGRRRRSR